MSATDQPVTGKNPAKLFAIGVILLLFLLVVLYVLTDRMMPASVASAMRDPENTAQAAGIIREINDRIGDYLAVKTLVNVILGAISFAILWVLVIDFPLFWALVIGLLNYIPYFGSLVGVVLRVGLSILQFGDLGRTLLLASLLIAERQSQPLRRGGLSVGLVRPLESAGRVPGRAADPMMTIVLSAFEPTRPFAILMADRVVNDLPPLSSTGQEEGPHL